MKHLRVMKMPVIFCVVWFACSGPEVVDTGGSGSEITNGYVSTADGYPVQGLVLNAYPSDFIPGSDTTEPFKAVTDEDGYFELHLDSSRVNVFAIDSAANVGAYVADVGDKDSLGMIYLQELGAVAGAVRVSDLAGTEVAALIRGSPFITFISMPDSAFRFESVPPGRYTLSYFINLDGAPPCTSGTLCNPGNTGGDSTSIVTVLPGTESRTDTTIHYEDLPKL